MSLEPERRTEQTGDEESGQPLHAPQHVHHEVDDHLWRTEGVTASALCSNNNRK